MLDVANGKTVCVCVCLMLSMGRLFVCMFDVANVENVCVYA